ncbi:ABC transporter substrate-binding protein [Acidisoma cladoniae]|uniref:ABC transporter substrate-binding protein n=1 Tax=Acidisoma cladoniae TaxID=3040935 RepID=UPI00254D526C|nr:ABC transporter substrate-binding protein [Acidisoma sp. PAMC 29798]
MTAHRLTPSRRHILQGFGATALAASLPLRAHAAKPIKIGYVSPETGPLAPFGAADAFVIAALGGKLAAHGITLEVRDSQSDPNRASTVANDLINDGVSLMLVSSTPETTNPVSDQCELAGVPCVSTVSPWQAWFFNRGGKPDEGFTYTYHFFWGLEDVIAVYTGMWGQLQTDRVVGALFPNDGDGNAWGDKAHGFPGPLAAQHFTLIDPGRFQDGSADFSAQINAFKAAKAEIVTGVVIPPDWTTFWSQALQQGFKPRVATVGKALLFPETVNALGAAGNNLSTEVWWTPNHPFTSSLTGQSAKALAAAYTQKTAKQWTQPIGFAHALLEIAVDTLGRASDPTDRESVLAALVKTRLDTIVGPIAWGQGPVKNVAKTPLVGGQWRLTPGGPYQFDLVITENAGAPTIPAGGTMAPIA